MAVRRSLTPKGSRARDRIVVAAERLFATHGFHGTSVRDVAAEVGVPLANLVYHFAKKEQLYAAVLSAIADELMHELDAIAAERVEPRGKQVERALHVARIEALVAGLVAWSARSPDRVRLLLRELLDNPARLAKATRFPLAPFLERAAGMIERARAAGAVQVEHPELALLHVIGAISYVVAAWPTVARIVGPARAKRLAAATSADAIAFARAVLGLA
ncbi:MAG TPA: TetR family transcriptional regulator [Kofleriaceae bacterium]|nr:TetR family transcriptional regulator [Kofleriaceae bacterium]